MKQTRSSLPALDPRPAWPERCCADALLETMACLARLSLALDRAELQVRWPFHRQPNPSGPLDTFHADPWRIPC